MPYPVDHDTRNRLSAIPMIASPLQSKRGGLKLAFSPKRVNGRKDGVRTNGMGVGLGGSEKGDITYINRLRGEGDRKRGRNQILILDASPFLLHSDVPFSLGW